MLYVHGRGLLVVLAGGELAGSLADFGCFTVVDLDSRFGERFSVVSTGPTDCDRTETIKNNESLE